MARRWPDPPRAGELRSGDVVDGVTAGPLLDLAWQAPVPGFDDKSSLLVLDANNNVFRHNQQVDGASVVEFGAAQLAAGVADRDLLGRLYVTDVGAKPDSPLRPGQRYEEPTNWFLPETVVNLVNPASRACASIATSGPFREWHRPALPPGEQMPYSLDNSRRDAGRAGRYWVGDVMTRRLFGRRPAERILCLSTRRRANTWSSSRPPEGIAAQRPAQPLRRQPFTARSTS